MSTLPLAEIRQFLRSHADLDIDGVRDDQLERRLAHYLRRSGIDEGDLIARLRADDELLESFLDSLTINVTALFRNADRWDEIDDLIEQMSDRPRIWSAGCSTGAEPFTIGILCHRLAKRPEIIATDIDTRVLGRAVEGLYTEPEMKEVPPDVASKYFTERDGMWSVERDIASMVRFRRHNLLADVPLPGPFDLVVCRNVTIYFSAEAKRTLPGKLASVVRPGGYLFIGSAERVEGPRDIGLSMVAPFIYERSAEVAARWVGSLMPNSSFLEQFVEEARENVEELVAGLLRLETEGETEIEHTVKELFRYAHNLKGMAGAMGLEGTTELAHKMEDLLERYRQGGGRPSVDEVDGLLAASDAVEAMIEEAASGGNPPAPPELVSLLVNHVAASLDKPTAGQAEKERPVPGELDAGHTALDVRLDENAQLLGARSAIVLRVIGEHGELVSTTPDRAALETGGVSSFVVVAQLADAEAAAAAVADVSDVVACAIVGCEQTSPKHAGVDRFEVQVDDAAQLPGARAAVVLQAFADRGTIESTNPDRQTIEAGKARTFVVELAGVEDAPVLASLIGSLTDVVACGLVKDAPQPGGAAKRDSEQRKGGSGQRVTVRVEVDRLDDLMDLVSELVVGRGLLEEQARRISDRSLGDALTSVQRTISDL